MKIIVLKSPFSYAGKRYNVGDQAIVPERYGKLVIKTGKAKLFEAKSLSDKKPSPTQSVSGDLENTKPPTQNGQAEKPTTKPAGKPVNKSGTRNAGKKTGQPSNSYQTRALKAEDDSE